MDVLNVKKACIICIINSQNGKKERTMTIDADQNKRISL
jgi:hypothetical protein